MLGFTTLSQAPLSQAVTLSEATITLAGNLATFSLGTLAFDAQAVHLLPTGTVSTLDITAVTGKGGADGSVSGTIASFSTGTLTQLGVANITPTGISATFVQNIDFDAKANLNLNSVDVSTAINSVDFDAQASITTGTTLATFTASSPTAEVVVRAVIEGVFALLQNKLPVPDAVRFPYEDFADDYDRGRTIYLLSYDENRVAFVTPENYTVTLNAADEYNTVHVTAQPTTVYIRAESEKNTVYVIR